MSIASFSMKKNKIFGKLGKTGHFKNNFLVIPFKPLIISEREKEFLNYYEFICFSILS